MMTHEYFFTCDEDAGEMTITVLAPDGKRYVNTVGGVGSLDAIGKEVLMDQAMAYFRCDRSQMRMTDRVVGEGS